VSDPSPPSPIDPDNPNRTTAGCFLLFIPAVFAIGIVVAYAAVFGLGIYGRAPTGERVTIAFVGCHDARAVIEERVGLMGLGEPVFADTSDGFTLTATLPADAGVVSTIPITLAAPGAFEIRDATRPDAAALIVGHVAGASVEWASTAAETLIQLDADGATTLREHMQAHSDGGVALVLDGEVIGTRANMPAEPRGNFDVVVPGENAKATLEIAAQRAVILESGPLPCAVGAGVSSSTAPTGS
jgi:hypothetical protein